MPAPRSVKHLPGSRALPHPTELLEFTGLLEVSNTSPRELEFTGLGLLEVSNTSPRDFWRCQTPPRGNTSLCGDPSSLTGGRRERLARGGDPSHRAPLDQREPIPPGLRPFHRHHVPAPEGEEDVVGGRPVLLLERKPDPSLRSAPHVPLPALAL